MNRSNFIFMRKITRWAGLFILVLAADVTFAQVEPTKPAKTKRVFTNDDLSRFGENMAPTHQPRKSPPQRPHPTRENPTSRLLNPRPPRARSGPNGLGS